MFCACVRVCVLGRMYMCECARACVYVCGGWGLTLGDPSVALHLVLAD